MKAFVLPFLAMPMTLAAATAEPVVKPIEGVSQTAIQSAFQILRSEYIRSNELTYDELNRAALQGLLQRLESGAELLKKSEALAPTNTSGLLAEVINPEIGYLRPLAFGEKEAALMEEKLGEFQKKKVLHVILDLRRAASPGNFSVAATMLNLFLPRSQVLFKMKQMRQETAELFVSSREPVWTRPLVVLVDSETCNLGETIAAVLQQRRQAVLLGSATRGATVRYETLPVDDHWLLRFARAEMLLPDDTSLFKKGLKPNFVVDLPISAKREVFDPLVATSSVKESITDHARQRYNEAALVARKNPEIESYIKRSAGESPVDERTQVRDTVLQRAVDMLQSDDHLAASALEWKGAGTATPEPPLPAARKATPVPNP